MSEYGLTSAGFISRAAPEIRQDIRQAIQDRMGGTTVDLSSYAVLSQWIDITADQLADVWALAAALYASAYPEGASGVLVDNLLAINNLARLPAKATVTDPTPVNDSGGNPQFGLVLFGTANTRIPAGTLLSNGADVPVQFSLDSDVVIAAAINAKQALYFSNSPTSGSYSLSLQAPSGTTLSLPNLAYNASPNLLTVTFTGSDPQNRHDSFNATIDGKTFSDLDFDDTGASFLAALTSIAAYKGSTITGTRASGWSVYFPGKEPVLSFSDASAPTGQISSVQAQIRALQDTDGTLPFADVVLTPAAQSYVMEFGALSLASGAVTSAAQPISLVKITANSLSRGTAFTSVSAAHLVYGAPAEGVGSATCTAAGANQVLAGQLTTIVNPVSGFSSCTNQLDCIAGRDVETDLEAKARLRSQKNAAASGSLAAIVTRVLAVSGVSQAVGFQNSTAASQQIISFASTPAQGSFALFIAGQTTGMLPYNISASALQTALQALDGLTDVTVIAAANSGYQIDFGPYSGAVAHDLLQIPSNTTGIEMRADWGCPSHAIEVVAEGGAVADVAAAILSALPAGIATYGRPVLRTKAAITAASATISVTSSQGLTSGLFANAAQLPADSQIQSLSGTSVSLNRSASATNAAASVSFGYGAQLTDTAGNAIQIRFSRPQAVLIYVDLTIQTDQALGAKSLFSAASVATIQQTLLSTINAIPIGGSVIVTGTTGLLNSFRSVPGILSVSIKVGRTDSPSASDNLQMAANETPIAEASSINITVLA